MMKDKNRAANQVLADMMFFDYLKDKVGNNLGLLPTLYYHCNALISDDYNVKQYILDYAQNHEQFEINQLVTAHIHFQTSRFSNLSLMMIY